MSAQNSSLHYHNVALVILFVLFTVMSLTTVTVGSSATSNTRGNETDRLALLAIKALITEDPFQITSSWNDSLHFCQWEGVSCGRRHNQRVTRLDLSSRRLRGQISPSIANLSFIRIIELSDNSFTGEIPREVSRLFRLQRLGLANNSLVGQIPPNMSFCSDLRGINFDGNKLTGRIPSELGFLSRLTQLRSYNNKLGGNIPPQLGNLSSLIYLDLVGNQLEGHIPPSFGQLRSLEWLQISNNRFSGTIPQSVYNLSQIKYFFVPRNQLEGQLPHDIGLTLPNIKYFFITKNKFHGPLSVSFENMSNLVTLDLSENNLFGSVPDIFGNLKDLSSLQMWSTNLGFNNASDLKFFTSLTNCSNMQLIDISFNNFGGSLPTEMANFSTKINSIAIAANFISGSIPPGIENLINLTTLYVENNHLSGTVPATIGKLNKLRKIYLSDNGFSGEIPSSLGNLTSLLELTLENNNLKGSIPSSLGNCTNLLALALSGNSLNGTIPRALIGLPSLSVVLNLSRNNLVGSLPSEVGKLVNLMLLDISDNKLSNAIPPSLEGCTVLRGLYMDHNMFEGVIPKSLSSLRGIDTIDLSHNNLSGEIPKDIATLHSLLKLDLSFNDLEGELPTGGVFSNASAISVSGNHKLCGGTPQLRLRACVKKKLTEKSTFRGTKLIISIVFGILAISILLYLLFSLWFKKKGKQQIDTSPTNPFATISYGDLVKATDGFSSENLIGVGSVGSVYKGILEEDQTAVAVKVFNLQKRGASKSFAAECETLRGVRHRNLVKIITACSSIDYQGNEFKALVYELMPNGNLENFLHPGPQTESHLTLSERVEIANDVASAVDYLHNNVETPILHCDLKPSNILLDQENVAHVGDFGLSRIVPLDNAEISNNQSNSSGLKGTIGYAAPEYGMGSKVSKEGDMYSFGILLLEIFTGKRPTGSDFGEGMNLNQFVKSALPERVMEIVDQGIVPREDNEPSSNIRNEDREMMKMRECCVSVLEIGVLCSDEFPRARMKIDEALKRLYAAKKRLL